ncbi:MAG: hypothetical protein Kow00114_36070 [Kiloniellaceae bacterium]
MAKIFIAGGQWMDAATLEDSSAVAANYPLSNLLTIQPGEKTRFSTPAAAHVVVDLGAARAVDTVALIAHNASAAGTWRVRGATSEANLTASPGYDSGAGVSLWPASGKPDANIHHSFLRLGSAQSYRWWRVDIADAGNADGYFQLGRLLIAGAWAPAVNYSFGADIGWVDPSPIDEGVGGHSFPLEREKHRVFNLPFRFQTKADAWGQAYELQRKRGGSKDVFAVLDPDEDEYLHVVMVHGLLRGTITSISNDFFQRYSFTLRIKELLP